MLIFSHFFPGIVPSKKNSRIITGKSGRLLSIPSKQHREWHKREFDALLPKRPPRPFEGVAINFYFIYPDKHRRDPDNSVTSIFDLLTDASIIKDDTWTYVPQRSVSCRLAEEGEEPGCQIFITNPA